MFLLASSSETYPSLSGRWIGKDTNSFVCHITSRLLQLDPGVCAKKTSKIIFNGFRTLQLVWSQEPRNTSVVFHGCFGVFGKELQGNSLTAACPAVFEVSGREHIRSASRRNLNISRFRRSTFGTRTFSVAGPTVCYSLPDRCVIQPSSLNALGGTWKRITLPDIRAFFRGVNAIEVSPFHGIALYKSILLLTIITTGLQQSRLISCVMSCRILLIYKPSDYHVHGRTLI